MLYILRHIYLSGGDFVRVDLGRIGPLRVFPISLFREFFAFMSR